MYFRYFVIIISSKRLRSFIWTNLSSNYTRMFWANFSWNWHRGSGEEGFEILLMYFSLFRYNLPLEKSVVLLLSKHESQSSKDALWKIWLKLAQWFWRRSFLNFVSVFSLFRIYLPLEKGGALHLNKHEFLPPKDAFWRRKEKNWKFTDRRTDGRQTIRKAHLGFHLRLAKTENFQKIYLKTCHI